jgi:gliding motility-associated-like protein
LRFINHHLNIYNRNETKIVVKLFLNLSAKIFIVMFQKRAAAVLLWWLIVMSSYSQVTGPEQDCSSAIPVCQTTYSQNNSYLGSGTIEDLLGRTGTCLSNRENNSVWYIFTVTQTGILEMSITPLQNDDYDFAIYNITNLSCADIGNNTAAEVRCSYSAFIGTTGMRVGFTGTVAGVADPPFLAPLNVTAGETYVLVVDNFNTGGGGYILDFSNSAGVPNPASIIDVVPPTMLYLDTTDCTPTRFLTLSLSENILCSSIDTLGTQFTITGPSSVNVIRARGADCNIGAFSNRIILELNAPIYTGGNYLLNLHASSSGLRLSDYCGNLAVNASLPFTMPDIISADFDFTIRASCAKDTFYFTDETSGTATSWSWNFGDGSPVDNAQNPVHVFPDTITYNVTLIVNGTDCSDTITKQVLVRKSFAAGFTINPTVACVGDTVFFTDTSPAGASNHLWRFGDGNIAGSEDAYHIYQAPGTYRVVLTISDVSTPGCSDSSVQFVTINPLPDATFTHSPDPICSGLPVRFNDASPGNITYYFWDFGNGNTSNAQEGNYTFPAGGTYSVTHIITDATCGSDTAVQTYTVLQRPQINLGNDTSICLSESITLAGPANMESYLWSTGETSRTITFLDVPSEVALTVTANGCTNSDVIFIDEKKEDCYFVKIPSAFSPNGDGKNDFLKIFLLRVRNFELKIFNRWGELVFETNNANVMWDGTYKNEPQDVGVFQYYIEGYSISNEKFFRTGNITLIR